MSAKDRGKAPRVPPRWFVRLFWAGHRAVYRMTGGRIGLWRPHAGKKWGALRLTTTGRRTGQSRAVIVGYLEDGPNLVALAMNGWEKKEPAWWLNLRSHPEATAELTGERRPVRARAATGEERVRLWSRWLEVNPDLDAYAALRPSGTAVVVLEPRPGDAPSAR